MIRPAFALTLLLASLFGVATAHAQQPPQPQELVQALQQGGYIIVFRHAMTDEYPEQPGVNPRNCSLQRNLSPAGRAQAQQIGAAFAALGFRVDKVTTSPFCRCQDTALTAFGRTQPAPDVVEGADLPTLQQRFTVVPRQGFNDVIVGHGAAGGLIPSNEYLDYGESVVVKPVGDGRFVPIVRVASARWTELAQYFRVR